MEKFARPGDFCPNEDYPGDGKLHDGQQQNLHEFVKTPQDRATLSLHNLRQDLHRNHRDDTFPQANPKHEILETLVGRLA